MLEKACARLDAAAAHVLARYASFPPTEQARFIEQILVDSRQLERTGKGADGPPVEEPELEPVKSGPLVAALKKWRTQKAASDGSPPHHIIFNETLWALATLKPRTMDELIRVKGIKEKKAESYGKELLQIIAAHADSSGSAPADEIDYSEPTAEEIQAAMKIMVQELKAAGGRMNYKTFLMDSKADALAIDADWELQRIGRVKGDWDKAPARDGSSTVRLMPRKKTAQK